MSIIDQENESVIREIKSSEGIFVLTDTKIVHSRHKGKNGDNLSTAAIRDVKSIEMKKQPRDRISGIFSLIGLIVAILIWQISTNEIIGIVLGTVVGIFSLYLLADFCLKPNRIIISFNTHGGQVYGLLDKKQISEAEQFVTHTQKLCDEMHSSTANHSSHPTPGGSPSF
tara:strand:- start:49 stop:558 length:510 start_codon:yes stop_codon:yes gene_type:complete